MTERWKILQGDALALLRDMPAECVDLVVTDPPYSSGGFTRGDRTASTSSKYVQSATRRQLADFAGDNRDQRGFLVWCSLWLGECLRVAKPGAFIGMFSDWRQLPTATDALQAGGWVWRGISGMHKPDARPQGQRPVADLEFIVWGTKGASEIDTTDGVGPRLWSGQMPRDREHQTQKPLEAMAAWVNLAPIGGLVLDPFAGSGTTGEAALLAGRRFIGFEITDHFATVACRRLSAIGEHGGRVSEEQQSLFGGGL